MTDFSKNNNKQIIVAAPDVKSGYWAVKMADNILPHGFFKKYPTKESAQNFVSEHNGSAFESIPKICQFFGKNALFYVFDEFKDAWCQYAQSTSSGRCFRFFCFDS